MAEKPGPSFREPPKQPTVHVRQPPRDDTPTIRTNDPVTNEAERRIAEEEQTGPQEQAAREAQKAQEEEAKRQQELADQRRELSKSILSSNEGFVAVDDSNREGVEDARREGIVHVYTVQSGPGGLDVEERVEVTSKGYENLRSVFGENLGVKK
jgi:hypothetical protein